MEDGSISDRYSEIRSTADRILDYIETKLRAYLYDSDDGEIRNASEKWRIKKRVKELSSVIRKSQDVGISKESEIPEKIEDLIGFRIVTKNKAEAKKLFVKMSQDCLSNDNWFCLFEGNVERDEKTFESAKQYSISSGYQAYHINFKFNSENRYSSDCSTSLWPIEIQIMSELWDFYAEFSRRYFYKPDDPAPDHLKPYILPLAKILDAGDDLVTNILSAKQEYELEFAAQLDDSESFIQSLKTWLASEDRLESYFGTNRIPEDVFLLKIEKLLVEFDLQIERLEEIFNDERTKERYTEYIAASPGVYYLPPWQKTLMFVLIYFKLNEEEILDRVNSEIWHWNLVIRPIPRGFRYGILVQYDGDSDRGFLYDTETRFAYIFKRTNFSESVSTDQILDLISQKTVITFTLKLESNRKYYEIDTIECK